MEGDAQHVVAHSLTKHMGGKALPRPDRQTDGLSGPVGTPTSRPGLARWTESAAPRLFGVGSVLEGKSPA